jgi:hypothetical protein
VAAPWHRFGAHNRGALRGGNINQFAQALTELRSLHVIGVAPETRILPGGVDRILPRVPQATESGHMRIPDMSAAQRSRELLSVVLRVPARPGNRADVDELLDMVRHQHLDKFIDRMSRVADGEDYASNRDILIHVFRFVGSRLRDPQPSVNSNIMGHDVSGTQAATV